ncbi:MAG TPA: hypothetical protein VFE65_32420 [Pseudonocardia sp.]|nr:hypothetical protein [Pseudonocardia sp.]
MNAVSVVGADTVEAAAVGVAAGSASAVAAPAEVIIPTASALASTTRFVVHIISLPTFVVLFSAVSRLFEPSLDCVTPPLSQILDKPQYSQFT